MKKISKRYFILYLSFLMILMIFAIPIYYSLIASLEEKTRSTYEHILASGIEMLEDELNRTILATDMLYSNVNVKKASRLERQIGIDDVTTIRDIREYYISITRLIDMPRSMGLVYGNGAIISNGYIYKDQDFFFQQYFNIAGYDDFDQWKDEVLDINERFSFASVQASVNKDLTKDYVLFIISTPLNAQSRKSFFYAAFDQGTLLSVLVPPGLYEDCEVTLYSPDGAALFRKTPQEFDGYVNITKASEKFGFSVDIQIPRSMIHKQFSGTRNAFFLMFAVYVAIGATLAVIYARYNTKPIRKLTDQALKISNSLDEPLADCAKEKQDELTYIDDFLTRVDIKLQESRFEIMKQNELIQASVFERLLNGYNMEDTDVAELKQKYLSDLPDTLRILLLQMNDIAGFSQEKSSAIQVTIKVLVSMIFPVCYAQFSSKYLVIVLDAERNGDDKKLAESAERLMDMILKKCELIITVAASNTFDSLLNLNSVFCKLIQILRLINTNEGTLVFQKEFIEQQYTNGYIWTNSIMFSQLIYHAKTDEARSLLDADINLLINSGCSSESELAQLFFCYRHALSVVLSSTMSLTKRALNIALPDFKYNANIDTLFEPLRKCIAELCVCMAAYASAKNSIEVQISRYIDNNFANPNLFASNIAKHFNIAESTVYRLFRNAHGESLGMYIDRRRMEYAMQLLEAGELSVKEIALRCGYANVNTFYKVFKRYYGVAPSSFM